MKSSLFKIAAGVVFAVAMIGCSGAGDNTNTTNTSNKSAEPVRETKAADNKNASGTSTTTASTSTASNDEKIGVAECDEYVTKYEACVRDKVPPASRSQVEAGLTAARNGWRAAAATPQGKASLSGICASALANAKTSMASYNCTW